MMRNRLYTKDEVIQVVEAALNALNNQSADPDQLGSRSTLTTAHLSNHRRARK